MKWLMKFPKNWNLTPRLSFSQTQERKNYYILKAVVNLFSYEYATVTQGYKYAWKVPEYAWLCLDMFDMLGAVNLDRRF